MKKLICLMLVAMLLLSSVSAFAAEYKDKATVKKVQQALNDAGYNCGTPDGSAGKKTKAAITDYQNANGLEATGVIDDALLEALGLAQEAEAGEEAAATEETVEEAPAELPHIMFQGVELGSTYGEIKDALNLWFIGDLPIGYPVTFDLISAGAMGEQLTDKALLDRFAYFITTDVDVAGHTTSSQTLFFVKPIVDGAVSQNEEDYILYAAQDWFIQEDFNEVTDDLKAKLTQLYGEPGSDVRDISYETYYHAKTKVIAWHGENDVEATLKIDNKDNVGAVLCYLWRGAQPLIDEALALPVPDVDNSTNMNGL